MISSQPTGGGRTIQERRRAATSPGCRRAARTPVAQVLGREPLAVRLGWNNALPAARRQAARPRRPPPADGMRAARKACYFADGAPLPSAP